MKFLRHFGRRELSWETSIILAICALGYSIYERPSILFPQGILVSALFLLTGIMQFMQEERNKHYIRKIPLSLLESVCSLICGICILWAYFESADYFLLFIGFIVTLFSAFFLFVCAALYFTEK